ncbi:MAG: CBS domain-containing protein [Proteobacteria bacterium]|nr:CBS domain-containing protein [Desulfobulbaceae bacterium]MBU4152825.1 CBS domain-containing protein [Pseudomonadota bacterium]
MTADTLVVKDFIIPLDRYPHLSDTQTLHDAVEIIQTFTCGPSDRLRYSELMVINDQNQLVGRVTLQDILQGLDQRLVDVTKVKKFEGQSVEYANLSILWEDSFFVECAKKRITPIKDLMSPATRFVKGEDPLLKALAMLLHSNDVIMPVVDDGRVVGVIRLEEIFKAISSRCQL